MEVVKKEVKNTLLREAKYTQLVIDSEFNIRDVMDDIEKITAYKADAIIYEAQPKDGQVSISGAVCFTIIYKSRNGKEEKYEGEIPFSDNVNIEAVKESDRVEAIPYIEDISCEMLNSRKLMIKGLLGNQIMIFYDNDIKVITGIENGQGIECCYKDRAFTKLKTCRKEMLRIREKFEIPKNKPNIKEIIFSAFNIKNLETRVVREKVQIRGEAELFIIYIPEDSELPYQFACMTNDISEEILGDDVGDDVTFDVVFIPGKVAVEAKADPDGEIREVAVEANQTAYIKAYVEEKFTSIDDMYSTAADINIKKKEVRIENLLLHNNAKTRVVAKEKLRGDNNKILQVCNAYGYAIIDNVLIKDQNMTVDGIVKACIVYISDDSENQFSTWHVELPFSYVLDSAEIKEDMSIRVVPTLDNISVSLIGDAEIEIRATVNVDLTAFEILTIDMIDEIGISPLDETKKERIPFIVGYIVKPGDTLWQIARKYYTTVDKIKELNGLESDLIHENDRLLIMKQ